MGDNGKEHKRETKSFPAFITKIDADQGVVEHLVAVFGNVDLGNDVIHPGSFTKTIHERGGKVRVIDAHNYQSVMSVIGKPLALWEVPREALPPKVLVEFPEATGGLMARTQYLMDTPEGKGAFIRIKEDAVDEYSFGFDALDSDYEKRTVDGKEITVRNLRTLKLYEYGPVIFAMNPATTTLSAKEAEGPEEADAEGDADVDADDGAVDGGEEEQETAPDPIETEEKAGRVLAQRNQTRLLGALQTIVDVLDDAGIDVSGLFAPAEEEDDKEEKGELFRVVNVQILPELEDSSANDNWDAVDSSSGTDNLTITGHPAKQDDRHADEGDGDEEPDRFEPGDELDQDATDETTNETEITPPEDGAGDEQQTDEGAGPVDEPPTYDAETLLQLIDIEQSELELLEV